MGVAPLPLLSETILTLEELAALGCIAVESTYTELFIEKLIWELCHLRNEQKEFLTERLMMEGKLDLLKKVAAPKLRSAKRKKAFDKVISDLRIANADRITAIHGEWSAPNMTLREYMYARNVPPAIARKKKTIMSADKLMETAFRIYQAHNGLRVFAKKEWPKFSTLKERFL